MVSAKAGASDWPPCAFIGTNFSVLKDLLSNLWFEAVVISFSYWKQNFIFLIFYLDLGSQENVSCQPWCPPVLRSARALLLFPDDAAILAAAENRAPFPTPETSGSCFSSKPHPSNSVSTNNFK